MKRLISISLLFLTSACTFNLSMANTEGKAEDVIDDTQTNTPDISPNLSIPLTSSPYDIDEIEFGCKG